MADPIRAMLASYVKSITFESNINEPYTIRDPFKEGEGGGIVDAATAAVKPKITVDLWDQPPLIIAPAGDPDHETRAKIKTVAIVGGASIAALALYAIFRRK